MAANFDCELTPVGHRVQVQIQAALNLYSAYRRENLDGLALESSENASNINEGRWCGEE